MERREPSSEAVGFDTLSVAELIAGLATLDRIIWHLDRDGTILGVNESVEQILGYEPTDLVGDAIGTIVAETAGTEEQTDESENEPTDGSMFSPGAAPIRDRLVTFEAEDGTIVPMTVSTMHAGAGLVCLCRKSSPETPESSHRVGPVVALDAIGEPVYALGEAGEIEQVNDALLAITGYDREELLGRHVRELMPAGEYRQLADRLEKLEVDGERTTDTFESKVLTSDGDVILTEVTVQRDSDIGDSENGAVAVVRDVSDHRRRERDLELLKQVLARLFRHNIRNELEVAMAHAEMVQDHVDEEYCVHVEEILETARRLLSHSEKARLIESVTETDEQWGVDLVSIVESAVETATAEYPEAEIRTDLPGAAPIRAHPDIANAVEELLTNALEHAPPSRQPVVDIWIDDREDSTTFFIEDESGGLADDEIDVLRSGTETDLSHLSGVGLWLVRWLAAASNANLIAHRTDEGTVMGIRFRPEQIDSADDGADVDAEVDADSTAISPTGGATSAIQDPFVQAPDAVRDLQPEQFAGKTVIGRVDVREQLEGFYAGLSKTGGHSVMITGEAGIGKTTLVEQFRDRLAERDDHPLVAAGYCEAEAGSPYHAFRHVLAELPGARGLPDILEEVGAFDARTAEEVEERKQALSAAVAAYLRGVVANQPVVLIIEDMHWAERGTVDLFDYLVEELGQWSLPICFVGTYRTTHVDESHPVLEIAEKATETGRTTVIELEPFSIDEVQTFLAAMFEVEAVPERFAEAVYTHTGGTPLFVSELARHLVETLGPVPDGTDLPADLSDVSVPDSIESAIDERLQALPETVVPTLELGSILGESFSFDVLWKASDRSADTLIECTNTLVRRDIWRRTESEIQFIHGMVREQTREAIPQRRKRRLHEQVADAIETVYGDELEEHAYRLGRHYQAVGNSERAFEYYVDAGEYASETYANEDAIDAYRRALEMASIADDEIPETAVGGVYADLAGVLNWVGDLEAASDAIDSGLSVAPADTEAACQLLHVCTKLYMKASEYDRMEETARELRDRADDLGLRSLEVNAIRSLGIAAHHLGRFEEAEEYFTESLTISEALDDRRGQAKSLQYLGSAMQAFSRYEEAVDYFERALPISEALGDRRGEAGTLNNLGLATERLGEYEQANQYYDRALDIFETIGDRNRQAIVLNNLGNVARKRGSHGKAARYYERSLAIFEEIGDKRGQESNLNNLGNVARIQGEYDRAADYYEQSLNTATEIGDRLGEALVYHDSGLLATCRGDFATAKRNHERALDIAREIGTHKVEVSTLVALARVARHRGRFERSRALLDESDELRVEVNNPPVETEYFRERAALAREEDALASAAEAIEAALDLTEALDNPLIAIRIHAEQIRLALAMDDIDTAEASVNATERLREGLEAPYESARLERLEGRVALFSGEVDAAASHWREAVSTFEAIGAIHETLLTLEALTELAAQEGPDEALAQWCERARNHFDGASESVQRMHRGWIDRYCD